MSHHPERIGVVQGAQGSDIQRLLGDAASGWRRSARIAGVIEDTGGPEGSLCNAGQLTSLTNGARFSIFQDQGRSSDACNVNPEGALSAGEAVRRDIEAGCDLVILSKFGKLEAEQKGGLIPAFVAAAEAGIPILTSVSPKFEAVWRQFTEDSYVRLPADRVALDEWWQAVRA
jgi:hypothetical protein